MSHTKCSATTKAGAPCQAYASTTGYCVQHDPASANIVRIGREERLARIRTRRALEQFRRDVARRDAEMSEREGFLELARAMKGVAARVDSDTYVVTLIGRTADTIQEAWA